MLAITALLFIFACIAACIAVMHNAYRNKLLMLNWPGTLSYYGLTSRVTRFFKLHGWQVNHWDYPPYQYLIANEFCQFAVSLYPSHFKVGNAAIRDAIELSVPQPQLIQLLITADVVPPQIINEALQRRLYVIHYSKLQQLVDIDPKSPDSVLRLFDS
jgi:hypothetical protein